MKEELNFINAIFNDADTKEEIIFQIFSFQYQQNPVYRKWCNAFSKTPHTVTSIINIPFLPISFFKKYPVLCGHSIPEAVFESSGTTFSIPSKHYITSLAVYKQSFISAFEREYGSIKEWCILGLLPSYLERQNSSLVVMVHELINRSQHSMSGFYLNEFEKLSLVIKELEAQQQKTLLIGVTFALLDFAQQFPMPLKHTTIMETGGMKGRKKELIREEVHHILKESFHVPAIHSEYGMTELLSQAYAKSNGIFHAPPWMKIYIRNESDPLEVQNVGTGILNIIDLANVYSCSFIATDDTGKIQEDGGFEVLGRMDNSDLRGCSLLTV